MYNAYGAVYTLDMWKIFYWSCTKLSNWFWKKWVEPFETFNLQLLFKLCIRLSNLNCFHIFVGSIRSVSFGFHFVLLFKRKRFQLIFSLLEFLSKSLKKIYLLLLHIQLFFPLFKFSLSNLFFIDAKCTQYYSVATIWRSREFNIEP